MESSSRYSRGAFKRSGTIADLRYAAEVAAAYDTIAADYDEITERDQWMRNVLWRHYDELFVARQRLLDVGCGTGLDACHLARRRVRVTGLDLSPRMVTQLESRARRLELSGHAQARMGDAAELADWPGKYFHGIISSFAALNTVRDLHGFAADAARLLLPRGRLVVHMEAPGDSWDYRRRVRREGREAADRHLRRRHRSTPIGAQAIRQRVVTASEAYHRYFEPHFRLRRRYGLGFLLPRQTMHTLPPRVADVLGRVEAALGSRRAFLYRSRYFVLDLESRTEAS